MRKIPWRNGTDDSDRFADDSALGGDSHRFGDTEVGAPRIGLRGIGAETQILDRTLQLRHRGEHARCPDFGHGDLAESLNVLAHRVAQLPDTTNPQLGVSRPIGVVEGMARGIDRVAHIIGVGVGGGPKHLFGRGVHGGETPCATGEEFPTDEQIAVAFGCYRHARLLSEPHGHLSGFIRRTLSTGRPPRQGLCR